MKFSGPGKWFSFHKGEQAGVLVLLGAGILFALLPRFIFSKREPAKLEFAADSAARAALIAESKHLEDSLRNARYPRKRSLFYSSEEDLISMGFSRETARKIRQKASSGGFKNYRELSAISGMDSQKLSTMFYPVKDRKSGSRTHYSETNPLELNSADSVALASLPGIGGKTARRILDFRQKLGGFYQPSQILETRWVDTQVLKSLLGSFVADPGKIHKITLQNADLETLAAHPYLSKKEAGLILAFCKQHNRFTETDLKNHPAISPLTKKRMGNYLVFF